MPRASPTKIPFSDSIRYLDQYGIKPDIFGAPDFSAAEVNRTLAKRDVPPEGSDPDRDDFYRSLNAQKLNLYDSTFGFTAVLGGQPAGQDIRVMMEGLTGCLGILIVSHNGMYYARVFERHHSVTWIRTPGATSPNLGEDGIPRVPTTCCTLTRSSELLC